MCVCSAPSLASYHHLLAVFYKSGIDLLVFPDITYHVFLVLLSVVKYSLPFSLASSRKTNTDILQDVMSELAGISYTCQDPDDGMDANESLVSVYSRSCESVTIIFVFFSFSVLFFSNAMKIVSLSLLSYIIL